MLPRRISLAQLPLRLLLDVMVSHRGCVLLVLRAQMGHMCVEDAPNPVASDEALGDWRFSVGTALPRLDEVVDEEFPSFRIKGESLPPAHKIDAKGPWSEEVIL